MVHCCVVGCTNKSSQRIRLVSFHRFPTKTKQPQLYSKWMARVNRKDFLPNKNTFVCSVHFTEKDFTATTKLKAELMPHYKSSKRLSENAVPSLLLTGENTDRSPAVKKYGRKQRREILPSLLENEESSSTDNKFSNFDASSDVLPPFDKECEVQCEMGLEILRNVLDVPHEIIFCIDASVQCELGDGRVLQEKDNTDFESYGED